MAEESTNFYHEKFRSAFEDELAHVEARWRARVERRAAEPGREMAPEGETFDRNNLRGLALSGGGIRSASFCMGVVQQLYASGVLDRLHYMSTVSGGGYTGSALTWFMTHDYGTGPKEFPFWGGEPAGPRTDSSAKAQGDADRKESFATARGGEDRVSGRAVVDYIRQRSSYLNPGAGFTMLSAAAIVLRSVLVSLLGYVLILAVFILAAKALGLFVEPLAEKVGDLPAVFRFVGGLDWFALAGCALLAVLALVIIAYSLATGFPVQSTAAYGFRRFWQKYAGLLLALALASFALSLLHWFVVFDNKMDLAKLAQIGGGATALGSAGGIFVRYLSQAEPTARMRILIVLLPPLLLFLLVAGLGVLAAALAEAVALVAGGWPALVLFTVLYSVWTNINLTGLHRFYRDRLMETFMPDPKEIPDDLQAAETDADSKNLADVCKIGTDGPYHLINTHLVLVGAKRARHRSRKGDNFLLSPLFCGSEATGYIRTDAWLPGRADWFISRRVGAMKLPTAMAISGAALNPRAGADGQGATKGGIISALLTILNLRLGYWVPSPKKSGEAIRPSYRAAPNFLFPGLSQGLFGIRHTEEANWLELSDGGHFENTGIYELVRRGVRTIVFADGSTDPEIRLSSFANVLDKIYIDFGVTIKFESNAGFVRMLKGSKPKPDILDKLLNLAEAGFAIATIKYPDGATGNLYYVKSTMIREVPAALYSYKSSNPLFPSESLADQFFSEQQFEAYRTLGFAVTQQLTDFVNQPTHADYRSNLGLAEPE